MQNTFDPLLPAASGSSVNHFDGFKQHMFMAFREFDVLFYETYVFTVVISFAIIWALFTIIQWIYDYCNADPRLKLQSRALTLLKDDLIKAGPYKRDRSGIPISESVIKLHAVIFKHSQKKIIEKEMDY